MPIIGHFNLKEVIVMPWWTIPSWVIAVGIGWGCTWLWFKRDKVRAKIAAEVKAKL
jgi:hypothetical protein